MDVLMQDKRTPPEYSPIVSSSDAVKLLLARGVPQHQPDVLAVQTDNNITRVTTGQQQYSPLSLVQECRGSALIGREDHSDAPPALLCHKEPARASKAPY